MALTASEEALVRQLLDQQAAILSLAGNEATITSKLGATKVTLADLVSASAVNDTDLLLIRQGTNDKSVAGSIIKALATQPDASVTVKGIIELATSAEVQTGTDAVRAVTPAALASVTATETRAGLVELATSAEAQAFTANKFIDGAKLAEAFKGGNYSLLSNGYQKLPSGLIIQWGVSNASPGGSVVTFPIAFTSPAYNVTTGVSGTGAVNLRLSGLSTTGFTFYRDTTTDVHFWSAIGK